MRTGGGVEGWGAVCSLTPPRQEGGWGCGGVRAGKADDSVQLEAVDQERPVEELDHRELAGMHPVGGLEHPDELRFQRRVEALPAVRERTG